MSMIRGPAIAIMFAVVVIVIAGMVRGQETASGNYVWGTRSISIAATCAMASISTADKSVTIDWKCVKQYAAKYRSGEASDITSAYAHVLQAIHDGEVHGK
jgi:hypothetical protein